MSQGSIRTPLGRVRGLGSAKHGAGHFIAQRVSAIALIFLVPWFLISLIGAVRGGYDGALAWVADPLNAVLALLAVGASPLSHAPRHAGRGRGLHRQARHRRTCC